MSGAHHGRFGVHPSAQAEAADGAPACNDPAAPQKRKEWPRDLLEDLVKGTLLHFSPWEYKAAILSPAPPKVGDRVFVFGRCFSERLQEFWLHTKYGSSGVIKEVRGCGIAGEDYLVDFESRVPSETVDVRWIHGECVVAFTLLDEIPEAVPEGCTLVRRVLCPKAVHGKGRRPRIGDPLPPDWPGDIYWHCLKICGALAPRVPRKRRAIIERGLMRKFASDLADLYDHEWEPPEWERTQALVEFNLERFYREELPVLEARFLQPECRNDVLFPDDLYLEGSFTIIGERASGKFVFDSRVFEG
eukprot:tig00000492_g1555.t1